MYEADDFYEPVKSPKTVANQSNLMNQLRSHFVADLN